MAQELRRGDRVEWNFRGAKVVGLHAHTGSGVFTVDNWQTVGDTLTALTQRFRDVRQLCDQVAAQGPGVGELAGLGAQRADRLDDDLALATGPGPEFEHKNFERMLPYPL